MQQQDFNPADYGATPVQDFDPAAQGATPAGRDKGFVAGAQRGAENVAGAVKGTYDALKEPMFFTESMKGLGGAVARTAKGIAAIPGEQVKAFQAIRPDEPVGGDDPMGDLGQAVTQYGVPALAGEALGWGAAVPRPSAEARLAAQQANADPLKLKLLEAAKTAKQNLQQDMAQVTGQIDKSPAMISRTEVYSGLTKYFGKDMEAAPLDVSRLISDAQRPAMSSTPGSMTNVPGQVADMGGSMRFGQLENLRQTIGQALGADKGNAALKGAYKEVSGMLDKLAGEQGLADKYAAAKAGIKDFHENVVPKGGIIDSATKPTAEDYQSIMKPLDTPALKDKVMKLKALGADIDPADVARRVKAYKTYEKSGSAIARHSLRPQSGLEMGGAVAGFGAGSAFGHPIIGAELGIQGVRGMSNAIRETPFPNFPEE